MARTQPRQVAKPRKPHAPVAPAARPRGVKPAREDAQVHFLIMSIMSAVVQMVEAKCAKLTSREQKTLQRHIEKAINGFVGR